MQATRSCARRPHTYGQALYCRSLIRVRAYGEVSEAMPRPPRVERAHVVQVEPPRHGVVPAVVVHALAEQRRRVAPFPPQRRGEHRGPRLAEVDVPEAVKYKNDGAAAFLTL